jgi:thymidylate kinase
MKKKNKISVVLFEGIDKTGKTTLRKELIKRRKDLVCVDRFTISNRVYDEFYKRQKFINNYVKLEKALKPYSLIVYLFCPYDEYYRRCKESYHDVLSKKDYTKQQSLFLKHIKESKLFVMGLDTKLATIEQSVEMMITVLDYL